MGTRCLDDIRRQQLGKTSARALGQADTSSAMGETKLGGQKCGDDACRHDIGAHLIRYGRGTQIVLDCQSWEGLYPRPGSKLPIWILIPQKLTSHTTTVANAHVGPFLEKRGTESDHWLTSLASCHPRIRAAWPLTNS